MIPKYARIAMVVAAGVLTVSVLGSAQAKDPFVGTWSLNIAKSTYNPGPPPKSMTVTYEAAGQGYKVSVKTELTSVQTHQWSYTSDLDGKDARLSGNNPNVDTIAAKRIDANTIEMVNKKGGKVTTTQRNVISADGKTRTVTTTGVDSLGRRV